MEQRLKGFSELTESERRYVQYMYEDACLAENSFGRYPLAWHKLPEYKRDEFAWRTLAALD